MTNSAIHVIDAEIEALNRQRVEALQGMKDRKGRLRRIGSELGALERVRARIVAEIWPASADCAPSSLVSTPGAGRRLDDEARLGPSEAILQFLQCHPNSGPGLVARSLAPTIRTRSGDPRKLVYAMIEQLVRYGRVVRDEKTRQLSVPTNGAGRSSPGS